MQFIHSEVDQPVAPNSRYTYSFTDQILPVKLIIPDHNGIVPGGTATGYTQLGCVYRNAPILLAPFSTGRELFDTAPGMRIGTSASATEDPFG